ncbi:hypothetical protein ABK040_011855 [Willaertia magna]
MLKHTIYAVFDHNRNYLYNENNYQYDNDTPIKEIPLPSYIPPLSIKSITSGNDFLLLLTVDGLVYVYGSNEEGRIGLGVSIKHVDKFTKIENLNKIIKIANSSECSILLSEKNELFVTGLNNGNRFGFEDDSINKVYNFTKIDILYNNELNNLQNEKIKLIRASYDFIYLVTEKNVIYGCGLNDGGQLGLGHTNRLNKFTKNETLQNINIKDLQCGDCHCLILDFNENVYCCGLNNLSQLTYEYISSIIYFTKYYENIKSIHCNANDSILLTLQNEIYFIGKGNKSQYTKYTMTDTFINSIKTDNLGDASILSNNSKEMFCNYKDLFKNYIYDDKTEEDITILVEAIDHKYKKINVPNCFDKYLNYFIIGISDSNIFILLSDYQFTDEDNNERQIKNLKLFFNNLLQQCLLTHKNNFCDVIIKYF